jgi:hypothetical protein
MVAESGEEEVHHWGVFWSVWLPQGAQRSTEILREAF